MNFKEVGMVVNFESVFKYPFKDKNWIIKILIGGGLWFIACVFSFFFVPILAVLPVMAYLMKILAAAKKNQEPVLPEWTDWAGLFKEGFMAFVVMFCYYFVVGIVLMILASIPVVGCLVYPLAIIVACLLGPVVAIALCLYLERKKLAAAFDLKVIIEKIKANLTDYLIISVVMGALVLVAGITLFLAPFIWFYLAIVAFRLYGEIYGSSGPAGSAAGE